MAKNCKYNKLISSWIDGELSEREKKAFSKHLEACSVCQNELEYFRFGDKAISDLPDIEPSADFDRNFWKKIHAIEEKKARWALPLTAFFGRLKPQLSAAFSVILIAGVILFLSKPVTPGEDDILIAENLELFQNYEMIDNLDLLENWEAFMDEKENT